MENSFHKPWRALAVLLCCACFACGCAGGRPSAASGDAARRSAGESLQRDVEDAAVEGAEAFVVGEPCSREQLDVWTAAVEKGGSAAEEGLRSLVALKAANCCVYLVKSAGEGGSSGNDAARGRELAEIAVRGLEGNAVAHYLLAYLSGLEAEFAPMRGLALVPVIEREALAAAELSSELDQGGPDRILGELYLRAPVFPVSVGDSSKALSHFERAVAQAPENVENRAGLVEALMAEGEYGAACSEIRSILERIPKPDRCGEDVWRRVVSALEGICERTH